MAVDWVRLFPLACEAMSFVKVPRLIILRSGSQQKAFRHLL